MSRITYDLDLDDPRSPAPGDLIVSPGTAYRITAARPVDSRVWANRWALTCQRVGKPVDVGNGALQPDPGGGVFYLMWYKRGVERTPNDLR